MTATNERVFINGKIFTARNEEEFVSAFKVTDGKFSWVGDASEVDSAGAIDLQGKTILPGFIDVHTHPHLRGYDAGRGGLYPADGQRHPRDCVAPALLPLFLLAQGGSLGVQIGAPRWTMQSPTGFWVRPRAHTLPPLP